MPRAKSTGERQTNLRASCPVNAVAMGKLAKFFIRDAQPFKSVTYFAVQHAVPILSYEPRGVHGFDRALPVL